METASRVSGAPCEDSGIQARAAGSGDCNFFPLIFEASITVCPNED